MSNTLAIIVVLAHLASVVVCFMKGKPVFALLGLLVFPVFAYVGAIRLAKPLSMFAASYYDGTKATKASARYA